MRIAKHHQIKFLVIACSIVFAIALFACSTTRSTMGKDEASISVTGSGIPGKKLEIEGEGFIPGESIELVLEMEAVPIIVGKKGRIIKVNEMGAFKAVTNYPNKYVAIPGSWDLIATGSKGSKAMCKVVIKSL